MVACFRLLVVAFVALLGSSEPFTRASAGTVVPETVVPETVVPETVVPETVVPEGKQRRLLQAVALQLSLTDGGAGVGVEDAGAVGSAPAVQGDLRDRSGWLEDPDRDAAVGDDGGCSIILSKLNYDDPGVDDEEFLELQAIGAWAVGATLADCGVSALVLLNGGQSNCPPYRRLEVAQVRIPASGFVVICTGFVEACDWGRTLPNGWIQNGPNDAIELLSPDGRSSAVYFYGQPPSACIDGVGVPVVHLPEEPANDDPDSVIVRCHDGSYRLMPKDRAPFATEIDCGERSTEPAPVPANDVLPGEAGQAPTASVSSPADPRVAKEKSSSPEGVANESAHIAVANEHGHTGATEAPLLPSDGQREDGTLSPTDAGSTDGRILSHRVIERLRPQLADAGATSTAPALRTGLPPRPSLPGGGCSHAPYGASAWWPGCLPIGLLLSAARLRLTRRRRGARRPSNFDQRP